MKDQDDELLSDGPLTPLERAAIRKIIRDESRMRWFWATLRIWAGYLSGAVIGGFALYEGFLRALGKK